MRKSFYGVLIFCGMVLITVAQARVYPLEEAVADGIALSAEVDAAASTQIQAREQLEQARSYNLPRISVNGNLGTGEDEAGGRAVANQDGERYSASLVIEQNIYSFGRIEAREKSARAGISAASFQRLAAESDAAEEVAIAYADFVFRENLVALRQSYVSNVQEQLDAIETHLRRGTAKRTDVSRIRSQFFQARSQLQLEQARLRASAGVLQRLTGKDLGGSDLVASEEGLKNLINYIPIGLEEAVTQATLSSPLVLRAKTDYERAAAEADLAQAELFPDIGIRGLTSRSTTGSIDSAETSIAFTGSMSLYEGGLRFSRVRQAREAVVGANNILLARKDETSVIVERIWAQLIGHKTGKDDIEDAVRQASAAVKDTEREVGAGALPVIALIATQKDLLDVEITLAENELLYLQAVVSLMKQIGLLTQLETIS